jgi:arylsulfatase A-like enzyme
MHSAAAGYFGLINHIDDRIRYVLTRLFEYSSPRQHEPTLIIFTSDHGEMLGDHQLWRKSLPYEGSAHVPYFMAWRNMPLKSGVCDELVCLEDIVATVLDAAGIPLPAELDGELEGKSLMPILRGESKTTRPRLFSECAGANTHQCVVEGDWKYIWFAATGEEQLFNLAEDPRELVDRSADAARLTPFRNILAEHLKTRDDVNYDPSACTPCENKPPRAVWGDRA